MRCLLVLVAALAAVSAEQFSYEGYKVFRLHLSHENQLRALASFNKNEILDFWSALRFDGKPIDVMVKPETQHMFGWFLNVNAIKHEIIIDNVEEVVQRERSLQKLIPRVPEGRISFEKFNRYEEIVDYMKQLAMNHSDIVSIQSAGKSYEERDLLVIKISTDPSAKKPVIFIDAGIHAREWLAPAQALYIIYQLVEVPENKKLLDKVDWYVMPLVNPDGYEYTHTNQRFWRKTRSPGKICYGTDANRNFGYHWGEIGASDNECSDTYMGSSAFSESESEAVGQFVWDHNDYIELYLTFHSYGKYLLYPWGFTSELPENYEDLQSLAEEVDEAIASVQGTHYTIGSSTNVLYPAAGGSDDWVKGVAGVPLTYTIELPGGGSAGFDPPPSQILGHVYETWVGVIAYHNRIANWFGK